MQPISPLLLLLRSTVSRFACPDSPSPAPHPELPSPASIASELSIIDNEIDDNCLFVSKIFVHATACAVLNDLIVLKVLTVLTPYPLTAPPLPSSRLQPIPCFRTTCCVLPMARFSLLRVCLLSRIPFGVGWSLQIPSPPFREGLGVGLCCPL